MSQSLSEGFEVEVIRGAARIMDSRPKLAIEIHSHDLPRYGTSVDELLTLLHLEDYECFIQLKDGEEAEPFTVGKVDISAYSHVHLFAVPKD